ncbi:MAG TPA: CocE/NonD family hydrolase [Caulobacteraceae bacterium]|nr:CocE/NonD family hydrolase [Caulobacteraceae bacterium]
MSDWAAPAPVGVREVENDWVPAGDGARLAISLWLPESSATCPVVLESIPYRKRDSTRGYSRFWGRRLAQCGVAYARLDCRGSGDSDGLLLDEYLPQEQADNAAAIAWLAAQPWCNGAVGMRGVSWGGFSTLQAAALRPPALKAIMVFCASDRRYTDDAHYVGGSFALTGLKWATSFKLVMAGPPDPEVFGPDWERAWRERLDAAPPIAARWLEHQREDAFWRQGSVSLAPDRIACPTYLVGGWADPYNDSIPRLLGALGGPTKALIGPWGHGYPSPASPGPGLVWELEEVRWWRQWLAGEATGVMDGPGVWAYLPEQSPALAEGGAIPGRWVAEAALPPRTASQTLYPHAAGGLGEGPGAGVVAIGEGGAVGLATPEWCPFSGPQYAQEQSDDDARSRVFDTAPLAAALDVLGTPVARLRVAANRPVAKLAARLCEVDADGRSWLVSYGVLNLTHRAGHVEPTPLEPGAFHDIVLPLYLTGRRFAAGSRIRLALSEALWPLIWPSPAPVRASLDLAGASLTLPVRQAAGPEPAFPILPTEGRAAGDGPAMSRAHAGGEAFFLEVSPASSGRIAEIGTTVERFGPDVEAKMRIDDPTSCRWRVRQGVAYRRGDWDCALEAEVELSGSATTFHVREQLTARKGGVEVFSREHVGDIPRDLM